MGIFDQAHRTAERGDPLTATRAGRMVDIRITDHARVRESDAAGAAVARGPREGGATDRAAGRHQRFGAEEEDERMKEAPQPNAQEKKKK